MPVFEILILLLLIGANGLFALSEIAIVSARRARLQARAAEGDERARIALELADAPTRFLSTVQVGITLVGIFAGAFGGATLSRYVEAALVRIPLLAPYAGGLALGLVVLAITYLSLVVGELVPKQVALTDPERIAAAVARPMRALSRVSAPVVRLLSASTEGLVRLLRIAPSTEPPVTGEEIAILLEQGTRAGVFEAAEEDLIKSVFRLADQRVPAIMTPRREIVWLDLDAPPEENRRRLSEARVSRLPVGRGSLDRVEGVVFVKELYSRCLAGEPLDLRAALHPPLTVPESALALTVLQLFRDSGMHLALVIDEYGGTQGLVTVTDLLEAIVGILPAFGEEPEVVQRADGSWLVDGMLPIEQFLELVRLRTIPGEELETFHTLGGFVMNYLGRIPAAGDHFIWDELYFEVVDMDGHRVDKVLVRSSAPEEPEDSLQPG